MIFVSNKITIPVKDISEYNEIANIIDWYKVDKIDVSWMKIKILTIHDKNDWIWYENKESNISYKESEKELLLEASTKNMNENFYYALSKEFPDKEISIEAIDDADWYWILKLKIKNWECLFEDYKTYSYIDDEAFDNSLMQEDFNENIFIK